MKKHFLTVGNRKRVVNNNQRGITKGGFNIFSLSSFNAFESIIFSSEYVLCNLVLLKDRCPVLLKFLLRNHYIKKEDEVRVCYPNA